MKKLFKFLPMLLMVTLLAGFASCSKDDDEADLEGAVSSGKMHGWIKLDDEKHDLNYCWILPGNENDDDFYAFVAASKDIDSKKIIKDRFDLATFEVLKNSQGLWQLNVEVMVNFSYMDEYGYVGYDLTVTEGENVVIEQSGDSFKIAVDNAQAERYNDNGSFIGYSNCSLLFNGKPSEFKNVIFE